MQISKLTSQNLKTIDADTLSNKLKYLIWEPIGGKLVLNQTSTEKKALQSFTQADLDNGLVLFVPNKSKNLMQINKLAKFLDFSSGAGFSFLVSDFLHQTRPEWFSIEIMKVRKTVIMEVNRKLNASPGLPVLISRDYLYAKIVNVIIIF